MFPCPITLQHRYYILSRLLAFCPKNSVGLEDYEDITVSGVVARYNLLTSDSCRQMGMTFAVSRKFGLFFAICSYIFQYSVQGK